MRIQSKRKTLWRGIVCLVTVITLLAGVPVFATESDENAPFDVDALSAVLMDAKTGAVLYAKNADEALPPASVTKVMTLLLVMEAVDSGKISLTDTVSVSEYAASMGGSQVYLEPGEEMSVEEMLKCVVIASANDAAVALAETIAGSEEAFVRRMNERAAALGMEHTTFENVTGLDDDTVHHLISAEDIAIMSRELLKHDTILKYSGIWMDTIRDGAFGLTNTNRLVRFYSGATGLKTGSTSKAKFCISATAMRENLHLIAVIMGSPTRDVRNEMAKRLLDWGFANFSMYETPAASAGNVRVLGGVSEQCALEYGSFAKLLTKGKEKDVTMELQIPEEIPAPIAKGETVGKIVYKIGEEVIGECDVVAAEPVEKISFWGLLGRMAQMMFFA